MRLCRFEQQGTLLVGFYAGDVIFPLGSVAEALGVDVPPSDCLLPFLTGGSDREAVQRLEDAIEAAGDEQVAALGISRQETQLKVPISNPSKLLLLAGNYSKHIEEGGGQAAERQTTFPYVFMKPPLTTLNDPENPIRIPAVSPDHIDWELELGDGTGDWELGVRNWKLLLELELGTGG